MKKRIILIALAVVLLLGCGVAAWSYFNKADESVETQWRWVSAKPDAGALSGDGYYYIPRLNMVLSYVDFATGKSVTLCSRPVCSHDSHECDAYIFGLSPCMFFQNEHLYYMNELGVLCRRDATGMSLLEIGTPGKQFMEEQRSVTVSGIVPFGDWLYYNAQVMGKETGGPTVREMTFIGRIHLTTGKDEVLLEEKNGHGLKLCAVKDGSLLVHRQLTGGLDREADDYLEQLRQATVTLERWDEATGEVTVLFQKKRQDCLEMQMIAGNKLYYLTTGAVGVRGDNYAYDLETGEEEMVAENTHFWHLGGGYAFRAIGDGKRELVNLKNGKTLYNGMYDITQMAATVVTMSEQGVVLQYAIDNKDGTGEFRQGYVTYASLADGLQEKDILPLNTRQTNITVHDPTTQPTDPSNKDDESDDWDWIPLNFAQYPPLPEEYVVKNTQYLPETVNNPDNLPVLKWVFAIWRSKQIWTQDAAIALNQMLADRNMPFRVQFIVLMGDYYDGNISGGPYAEYDLLGSAEAQELLKDADLIFGNMNPEKMQALLSPITEYVMGEAQPTLHNAVAHRLNWLTTTVDGEVYGIAQQAVKYSYNGWYVDKALMEKAGLTPEDFRHNFWEMDETFEKLYKANDGKPFMPISNQGKDMHLSGASNKYGILPTPLPGIICDFIEELYQKSGVCFGIDDSGETPAVVNILEKVRYMQEAVIRYADAGYYAERVYLVQYGATAITDFEDAPAESDGKIIIPVSRARFNSCYGEAWFGTNGVAAVSQHKKEAVQLLHLLAEDEAFRNQFLYGREGKDYTVQDGQITPIKGEDGACYSMAGVCEGYARLSDAEELQVYRDSLKNVSAVNYPVVFDYSQYEEELEEIGKILGKYYMIFFSSEPVYDKKEEKIIIPEMTPELYDRMLQELKAAGCDEIQTELQRQLDAWLAANPEWDK